MENCKYLENQYLNVNTADVYFTTENNERFAAHKGILAANSLVLDKYFKESIDVNTIQISNASSAAFKEFLFAFYSKYPEKKYTVDNAISILTLAKMFDFVFCIHTYEQFLMKNVNIDTVCVCFSIAKRFELVELELFCNKQINTKKEGIFKSNGFLSCELSVLEDVLKCLTIRCRAEVKMIWDGCLKWAEKKCVNLSIDPYDMKNRRKLLGKCFDTMTAIAAHDDIAVLHHFKELLNANQLNGVQMIDEKSKKDYNQNQRVAKLVFTRFHETMLATNLCSPNDVIKIKLQTTQKLTLNGIALACVIGTPTGQIDIRCGENETIWKAEHFKIIKYREPKNCVFINDVILEPNQIYTINMQLSKETVFYRNRIISNTYQGSNVNIAIHVCSRRDLISHLIFTL